MGNALTSMMSESKKIDIKNLLDKYLNNFQLEKELRKDVFITIIVTPKKELISKILTISPETPLIFKIFPIENTSYLKYSEDYKNIKKLYSDLKSSPNVLPIIKLEELKEAKMGVLMRQYIKYNLNDLQYHMHCVSEVEKKWVCLQLLQGLSQIHSKSKCHGDIKPNNILLSSKLSVFYSDISVYKPAYLPIEDLQSYNTFFYSSEHDKSCYLAPERFIYSANEIKNKKKIELTPEMDIFSLGVVMSEIFLEKSSIFTQNDMINYKSNKIDLKQKLIEIKDLNIRSLLQNMIEIEPSKRAKLKDILSIFTRSLCPSPLTKLMIRLNLMIVGYEYYKNDLLIALFYKHFQQIWKCLCINNGNVKGLKVPILKKKLNKNIILSLLNNPNDIYKIGTNFPLPFIPNKDKTLFIESEINEDFFIEPTKYDEDNNNDCTIIIIKYLLSCLENVKYISTYFVIFEMIHYLSQILIRNDNSIIILDFIVPYYMELFKTGNSRLSIEVYNSLINLLSLIDFDKLILNQNDYNSFNDYIFKNICDFFFSCDQLEVQCAIISRLDEIIELENNFLYSYLNTINYIINKKKESNDLNKSLYNSILLFQSLVVNKNNKEKQQENKKDSKQMNFNEMYKIYKDDLSNFKKKLKKLIENIMITINEKDKASNDCLKLMIIQKYKEICMFFGNYNENEQLFNYLFILFNRDNYYIQKEIIKIFPGLILLFGRKLYLNYFLPFVELVCQKKNSELMIIEIIDAILLLTKMNLISHDDDYSRIYKILIPYFVHPNFLLRYKLWYLFSYIILDKRNTLSNLYKSFYHNIKFILMEYEKNCKNDDEKITTMINIIDIDIITFIREYYSIPREVFLLYKYNIESNLFATKYANLENLLNSITKIKRQHYDNKVKKSNILQKSLGLVTQNEIFNIKEKKFYNIIEKEIKKVIKNLGIDNEKNSAFVQTNIINKLIILFNELNNYKKNKKSFIDQWYFICGNQNNIYYSKILYLLKVLNYKLDQKNIEMINLMQTEDDNLKFNSAVKDFLIYEGSKCKSINLNMSLSGNNLLNNFEKYGKFCYKLLINENETLIKLIPVNNFMGKNYVNMFISISDEGVIRLHKINNEANFDDIYTIKNCSQYNIDCGNYIIKKNNISYLEQPNKIIVIIAIKTRLHLVMFELNTEDNNTLNINELETSYVIRNIECESNKEIISIESIYNNKRNYLTLGNIDNSISFYNYIDNKINYTNNCASFSGTYGNIELITTLSTTNNILVTTSRDHIILYDYNLRLFTYVYSFSIKKKIKQITEFIPLDYNAFVFDQHDAKKTDNEKSLIYILTDTNEIILWNLSMLKPINIYQFIKTDNIEEYKRMKHNYQIPEIKKLPLKNNEIYDKYYDSFRNDISILTTDNDLEIIKMNLAINYNEECSIPLMLVGDKSGKAGLLRFSKEILNKIKKDKQEHNKYNQLVIWDKNINVKFRCDSKFKNSIFIHKNYISTKDEDKKNDDDLELNEMMNDILLMRDFNKNINYIVACYSNGVVKLYTI